MEMKHFSIFNWIQIIENLNYPAIIATLYKIRVFKRLKDFLDVFLQKYPFENLNFLDKKPYLILYDLMYKL